MSHVTSNIHVRDEDDFNFEERNVDALNAFHVLHVGDDATIFFGRDGNGVRELYNLMSALESYLHGIQEEDLHDSPEWLGHLPHEEVVS